jgi:capsid protein
MKLLGIEFFAKKPKPTAPEKWKPQPPKAGYGASYNGMENGTLNGVWAIGFDGETNMGAVGPVKSYSMDYEVLRLRSRQLYVESNVVQTIIDRRVSWIVGSKLKLQCEPKMELLKSFKISFDKEEFNKKVESFFYIYLTSTMFDYAGVMTGMQMIRQVEKEREVAGDILVVLRVVDGVVKVQHIDAQRVMNPLGLPLLMNKTQPGFDYYNEYGHRVRNGVEIDDTGRHVAYYVRVGAAFETVRVLAYGKNTGMRMAYLVYDKKMSIDATRAIPRISQSIETASVIKRYSDATVKAAEEHAKNIMFFTHDADSEQEDPLEGTRVKASAGFGVAPPLSDIPVTSEGTTKMTQVAISENGIVNDLPKGVDVKALESQHEIIYKEFMSANIDVMCASADIPSSVAMCNYEGSFSKARMEGKDWEHTFMTEREDLMNQYFTPIYMLQLYMLAVTNYIDAMPYVRAVESRNYMVMHAYLCCRFAGDNFPDIDPLKTANYLRKMLGAKFDNTPIMTMEAAAEIASQGDFTAIIEQAGDELEMSIDEGFKPDEDPKKSSEDDEPDPRTTEVTGGGS